MNRKKLFLLAILLSANTTFGQNNKINIAIENFSSNRYSHEMFPNQNGIYNEDSNTYFVFDYFMNNKHYDFVSKIVLTNKNISINQFGISSKFKNHFLKFGILPYQSSKNNDFVLSQNSEPLLSFQFGTIADIQMQKKLSNFFVNYDFFIGQLNSKEKFLHESEYNQYVYSDYLINPYLHKKTLNIGYNFPNYTINLGFNHGVMFGGKIQKGSGVISPDRTLRAFLDSIAFQSASENYYSADLNFEGNHLGYISFQLYNDIFEIYYDKIFDDKSGLKFQNGFDGILGLKLSSPKKDKELNVEILSTKNQSGNLHIEGQTSGVDSYYWHHIYTSGWNINGKSLGHFLLFPNNNRLNAMLISYTSQFENKFNFTIETKLINQFQHYGPKNTNVESFNDNINLWKNFTTLHLTREYNDLKYTFSLGYINDEIKLTTYKLKVEKELFF